MHLSNGGCGTGTTIDVEDSGPTIRAVSNLTIDHGAGYGILMHPISEPTSNSGPNLSMANDTFIDNAGAAVELVQPARQCTPQASWGYGGMQGSGNGCNCIQIDGGFVFSGNSWRITQDPGLPVFLTGGVTVQGGAAWSMANLRFLQINDDNNGAQLLDVQGGGTLAMTGTATVPISVTAVGNAQVLGHPPCWGGIRFDGGSSGAISFAHLSSGGCDLSGTIETHSSVPLSNLTIDHGAADGIFIRPDGGSANNPGINPAIANDTFTANAGAAVEWNGGACDCTPQASWGYSGLHGSGNGCNCIQVDGGILFSGNSWRISEDPGLPVLLAGSVTVQGGATVSMANLKFLQINDDNNGPKIIDVQGGTLNMAGTADGADLRHRGGQRAGAGPSALLGGHSLRRRQRRRDRLRASLQRRLRPLAPSRRTAASRSPISPSITAPLTASSSVLTVGLPTTPASTLRSPTTPSRPTRVPR